MSSWHLDSNNNEQKTWQVDIAGMNVNAAGDICLEIDNYIKIITDHLTKLENSRISLFGNKANESFNKNVNNIINKINSYLSCITDFKNIVEYAANEWSKKDVELKDKINVSKTPSNSNNNEQNTSSSTNLNQVNLSDKQEMLITKFSYINLDEEKLQKDIAAGKQIKVKDLNEYIINSDKSYLGIVGKYGIGIDQTNQELLDEFIDNGLGDLTISDVYRGKKSGLNAMAFSDDKGNMYFSYRGTEFDISSRKNIVETMKDVKTDVVEYLTGKNDQLDEALDFYNKNKNKDGNNYLYGHSLAGNIVNNIYVKDSDNVSKAFVVNALPLKEDQRNNEALKNEDKYESVVIEGDWVSRLENANTNDSKVVTSTNSKINNFNIFSHHAIESAEYDSNGNFKTKEENNSSSTIIKAEEKIIDVADNVGVGLQNFISGIRQ